MRTDPHYPVGELTITLDAGLIAIIDELAKSRDTTKSLVIEAFLKANSEIETERKKRSIEWTIRRKSGWQNGRTRKGIKLKPYKRRITE